MNKAEIRAEIRATKAAMRAGGIKRTSCFNGGHSAESYRFNARLFELETLLLRAETTSAATYASSGALILPMES